MMRELCLEALISRLSSVHTVSEGGASTSISLVLHNGLDLWHVRPSDLSALSLSCRAWHLAVEGLLRSEGAACALISNTCPWVTISHQGGKLIPTLLQAFVGAHRD